MQKFIRYFCLLILLFIPACFTLMFVDIQYRLWRNGEISRQLAEELREKYPNVTFGNAASYEKERIYITVVDQIDDTTKLEVERWLHAQKSERKLSLEIWLIFFTDRDEKRIKI